MTEFELFKALRPLFPAEQYALLPQVANSTGFKANRHADAIALGLWPSRGIHLHGFEIKSYRSDWMRELKNPQKAETIAKLCNFWWVVAGPDVVLDKEEIPPAWGYFMWDAKMRTLKKQKQATYREAEKPDINFIAAILRKAQEAVTPDSEINEAYNSGFEAGRKEGASRSKYDQELIDRLRANVAHFKAASGIDLANGWHSGEEVGKAVKAVLDGNVSRYHRQLVNTAKQIIADLDGKVSDV